jgi:hypothetical protein
VSTPVDPEPRIPAAEGVEPEPRLPAAEGIEPEPQIPPETVPLDPHPHPADPSKDRAPSITLQQVQGNEELSSFISAADRVMEGLGFTEHGFRHANLVANISYQVLNRLGFGEHQANLGSAATC